MSTEPDRLLTAVAHLQRHGPVCAYDVATYLGLPSVETYDALHRLAVAGLLMETRKDRPGDYYPPEFSIPKES